jgi:hypothetical protein
MRCRQTPTNPRQEKTAKQAKTTRICIGLGGVQGLKLKSHDQTGEKQSEKDCLIYCFCQFGQFDLKIPI